MIKRKCAKHQAKREQHFYKKKLKDEAVEEKNHKMWNQTIKNESVGRHEKKSVL